MGQLFPKWTNQLPQYSVVGTIILLTALVAGVWYYWSPQYLDVGYAPKQPVPFSHKLHAGHHDIDCQYCHSDVFRSRHSNVPATQTCMNCHSQIKTDSPRLTKVRQSWKTGKPIKWVKVHNLPDFVYFNHAAHVNVGVGCESCHGRVDKMEVVAQKKPLSMSWCLDCHRNPEKYVRPVDKVTAMGYQPKEDQMKLGRELVAKHNINPPTYCQGCHY